MFKTLKTRIDKHAQMGQPQTTAPVQTLNSVVSRQVKGNGGSAPIAAHDALLPLHMIIHESGSIQKLNNPSLGSLIDMVINDPTAIVPPLAGAQFNALQPSVPHSQIAASRVALVSMTPRKIEPYEQLTGLSTDRPEVIMATQFQPLYRRDVKQLERASTRFIEESGRDAYVTSAGSYVDTQFQLMHLRTDNVKKMIRSTRKSEPSLHRDLHKRTSDVHSTLSELQELASFLTAVLDNVSRLRESFDLQGGFHVIDPSDVLATHIIAYHKRNDQSTSLAFDLVKRYLPSSYTPADCLVRLGYAQKNVNRVFTSTKVWMQMMEELRRILRNHSLEFVDVDTLYQRADSSSTNITSPNVDYFDIRDTLPPSLGVETLKNTRVVDVAQRLSNIETAYKLLYTGVHFKTEESRLAAIFKMLTNEFRYSVGLSQPGIEKLLTSKFNFSPALIGNVGLFDAVVGTPGSTVMNAPSEQSYSLAGFAQRPSGSIVVLPFESQFIESDQGTASAGGPYYVDELFNIQNPVSFNVTRLEQLVLDADARVTDLRTLVDAFNIGSHNFVVQNDKSASSTLAAMSTPFLLSDYVSLTFIDKNGVPLKFVQDDPSAAVFALAHTDARVRSILFMVMMARLTRSYLKGVEFANADIENDSTPVTVDLINRLQDALRVALPPTTRASNPRSAGDIIHVAPSAIVTALVADKGLVDTITDLMVTFLNTFNSQNKGMVNGRTRFSAFHDTIVLMVLFDAVCSVIFQFSGKSIVGVSFGRPSNDRTATGVDYYVIASKRHTTNPVSYSTIVSRLEKEEALTRQLIYTALAIPHKLSSAIKIQLGFFSNPTSVVKLRAVAVALDNKQLLRQFFTEQQIRLFVTEAFDLTARAGVGSSTIDSNDVMVIDDTLISPKMREILDEVFFGRELSTPSASNKRILTIGLPNGLVHRIQQRAVAASAARPELANDRRATVVSVTVHRVDLEHPDIVFKPKRFLFDAATFVVKEDSKYLEPLRATTDTDEAMFAIPLRDLGPGGTGDVEFAVSRSSDPALRGRKQVFTGPDYSFLHAAERSQMIHNHVMSYLLEAYLRLTTGVHVAENVFRMVEPPPKISASLSGRVLAVRAQQATSVPPVATQPHGVVFHVSAPPSAHRRQTGINQPVDDDMSNASGVHGRVTKPPASHQPAGGKRVTMSPHPPSPTDTVNNVAQTVGNASRAVEHVTHDLKNVQHLQQTITNLSDPDALTKHLIVPKQFDRVFNVLVDPNDFEVDVQLMTQTPHGRDSLAQNIRQGLLVATTGLSNVRFSPADSRIERYKHVARDTHEGDLIFDKYFVAVETYDELKDENQ